jgi:hypothetical protein
MITSDEIPPVLLHYARRVKCDDVLKSFWRGVTSNTTDAIVQHLHTQSIKDIITRLRAINVFYYLVYNPSKNEWTTQQPSAASNIALARSFITGQLLNTRVPQFLSADDIVDDVQKEIRQQNEDSKYDDQPRRPRRRYSEYDDDHYDPFGGIEEIIKEAVDDDETATFVLDLSGFFGMIVVAVYTDYVDE